LHLGAPHLLSSDEALKVAIKAAVDSGEYERAAALVDVAMKRRSAPRT
jgi:hypothetical protein